MTSRLIAFLLLLAVASGISAQDIVCPQGSSLQTDATVFTISASPKSLKSTLGDFYSNSLGQFLLQTATTFTPTLLSRTLHLAPKSLDITETLISSTPLLLQWELSSGPFVLPSNGGNAKVLSYNQSISILPVCFSDSYTTVTWSTHACISPPPERQEEGEEPINWFKLQHRRAASNIFDTVSRGWFGPVSTDNEGTACPADTRDPVVPSASDSGEALKERAAAPAPTATATTGVSSSISGPPETGYPVPTTTYSTSYPILPLPVTVSMPSANATWSTVGVKDMKTSASTNTISMATYTPGNGATGRCGVEFMAVVAAIGGWLFV